MKLQIVVVVATLVLASLVPCNGEDQPGCYESCPPTPKPVCAWNSKNYKKTFEHPCNLRPYNCEHREDYKVKFLGRCPI